ncbi:MAG TPA: alpha/beta fold hydrolase [Candidatus Cybelea sp.]|jgi:pimeloyl-ACP methyl ester carboxylesterase|nr:alpha/beta fold hydrolase [Candidatus Cybelea sp.]
MTKVELFRIEAQRNPVALLWYEPRRPRRISIVAGHGYSSSKQNLDFLCGFLASHGFGVYSLDFPGHKLGSSCGVLRGVDDCIEVMMRVVAFSRERSDDPVYTMGHSMGGMTAIFTAALDPNILGAIAIATGYGRPTSLDSLRNVGNTDFRASYVVGVPLPELVAGVEARYDELLGKLAGRASLYVAASRDGMVSPRSVNELYGRAPESKTLATVDSDHTYAAERSRAVVLEWLDGRHPPIDSSELP